MEGEKLHKVMEEFAAAHGMTMHQLQRRCEDVFRSNEWRRETLFEACKRASAEVACWPKWKRDAAEAQLNQPYVEPPDRGIDGNARW